MPGGLEKLHGLSPFLARCLSSTPLISLSLSLSLYLTLSHSVFFHPLLLYLLCLALSVNSLSFPFSNVPFSLLCLYQSLGLSCSVAFFTSLPCDIPLVIFLSALSSFFSRATTIPLFFVNVSLFPSCRHSPCGSCWISLTGPGPHGSCWPVSSQPNGVS